VSIVFKVMTVLEWEEAEIKGIFSGSAADHRDGFIHLSTADQTEETVSRHFSDSGGLVLAAVDANALGSALRWERSRGGALFPHLYRALQRHEIKWTAPFDASTPGDLNRLLAG
jgi:uncharacterized protein (DUF952 family)